MAHKTVLLDGYSLIYRAYHAMDAHLSAPDGTPTNAVHGFVMMLLRILSEEAPEALAVAFDVHAQTLRAARYAPYKATRAPMPEDLIAQVPVIREVLGLMNVPILEKAGYEADDVMGTVSRACEQTGREALLVTGDRDAFQLAGPMTTILYTKKGITNTERVTPDWLMAQYGLTPKQFIDLKGLMGDASDNIPGIPGIGEKTALKLLGRYETLERTLDEGAHSEKGRLRERLETYREQALLSRELATIDREAPVDYSFEAMARFTPGGALARLRELGMQQAVKKMEEMGLAESAAPAAEALRNEADLPPVETLADLSALRRRAEQLSGESTRVAVAIDRDLTIQTDKVRLCFPLGGDLLTPGATPEEALDAVAPLLEADAPKDVYDVKSLPWPIERLRGDVTDVMLAAYALNPSRPSFGLRALCEAEGVSWLEAHPATSLWRLSDVLRRALIRDDVENIYRDVELPVAKVLRDMERAGFLVDADRLRALGVDFRENVARLETEIAELAGERINLNSPKQLGEMLFGRMGLPAGKKTSRGWSTSAEVLEGLQDRYPICEKILSYRKYQKLESTYIVALTNLRDAQGRVHTRFDQVGTVTGRLSSSEPNLQNIPVRTDLGRQIREAFVAPPGCVLVDADYSQIELRVLAHISGDRTMIEAFREGQDIHARTAAEVYGVPLGEVTPQMRTSCKAVNFGIVYGISDFALAKNIGVSRWEARAFIDRYFEKYPGVKRYMSASVEAGKARGYVTTLLGRRRYLPELESPSFNVRAFGERCAMNSPIQGTAADIIKLAMVAVSRRLKEEGFKSRLLLQVHDELIVEAPTEEADRVCALLRDAMERAVSLDVPLVADISTGGDWRACK